MVAEVAVATGVPHNIALCDRAGYDNEIVKSVLCPCCNIGNVAALVQTSPRTACYAVFETAALPRKGI